MMTQAIELNNRPHVVIATPGRMVDHLKSSNDEWDLSRIKFLVCEISVLIYRISMCLL
jgi:ATP-dependent RNA helicase DDX49/DBP8